MSGARNQVLLALALASAAALLFTGFVSHAPNRLLSGHALPLWHSAPLPVAVGMAGGVLSLLVAAFVGQGTGSRLVVLAVAAGLILLALFGAGRAAANLVVAGRPAERTSLGPAFWILVLCAALAIVDMLQRLDARPGARLGAVCAIAAAVAALLASGALDDLSVLHEYASHRDAFALELIRHTELVLAALAPALVVGAPLGILTARRPALGRGVYAALNLLQTVPSVALFGLLIAPLSAVAAAVPTLRAIGVQGIGFFPATVALVLYALLPVVRNTQAGIASVDPAVVEAARGVGMTSRQIFWRVEAPLALPVFLAGIRIVLVQTIGLAVVAALIGAGGLGSFVFQGVGQYATDLVLLGAIPTILLALGADLVMRLLVELARRQRTLP